MSEHLITLLTTYGCLCRTGNDATKEYAAIVAGIESLQAECAALINGDEYQAMQRTLAEVNSRCESLQAELAKALKDAAIGKVVWKFIDRMGDVCEEDTADTILREFYDAALPAIEAALPDFSAKHKEQP